MDYTKVFDQAKRVEVIKILEDKIERKILQSNTNVFTGIKHQVLTIVRSRRRVFFVTRFVLSQ